MRVSAVAVQHRANTDQLLTHQITDLRRHLRSKVACEEDAQDIAQEACLKMLQVISKTNDIRNPKAYLYRIAHHLLYHHYTNRTRRCEAANIDIDSLRSTDDDVETLTIDAIRRQQINSAMRELPPKCQTVLLLRWREGLRVAEIAKQMCLSQGMVKKYLATGIGHFRKRLNPYIVADHAA